MNLLENTLQNLSSEVEEIKKKDEVRDEKIFKLEKNDALQDRSIQNLEVSIGKIEENTTWLRRTITKALFTGGVTFVLGIVSSLLVWAFTL
ncbi:hemolysin XhlA family protein [Salibacterium qingdaonense]|uniref:Haemolysin XhlA n=1 Tax=Salibacterium qingdaonense TaxID=266892 RepID=A0A1I4KQC2_9BACI|nr:hemolysin XhlA family protein [Salibacterium qingdaonense]SFL80831.1 Haemolysin XhlA [Salibacterium qingdaonense]